MEGVLCVGAREVPRDCTRRSPPSGAKFLGIVRGEVLHRDGSFFIDLGNSRNDSHRPNSRNDSHRPIFLPLRSDISNFDFTKQSQSQSDATCGAGGLCESETGESADEKLRFLRKTLQRFYEKTKFLVWSVSFESSVLNDPVGNSVGGVGFDRWGLANNIGGVGVPLGNSVGGVGVETTCRCCGFRVGGVGVETTCRCCVR